MIRATTLQRRRLAQIMYRRRLAQRNPIVFIEEVLKDEKGERFKCAPIHVAWQNHITYCWSRGLRAAIFAPWGHGKTVQIVIGRILWEIGRNRNIRIKIVSNGDDTAQGRVKAITEVIETNKAWPTVFGKVHPDRVRGWSNHQAFVTRDQGVSAIDATVHARGILSTGIGGRCDLLVGDDIVDFRNTIEQPAKMPKINEDFDNVWLSRLEPNGRAVYICTLWHIADLSHVLMNRPEWCCLLQRISKDFTEVESEVIGAPDDYPIEELANPDYVPPKLKSKANTTTKTGAKKYCYPAPIPLWQARWSEDELRKRAKEAPGAYERGFRQVVIDTNALLFRSFSEVLQIHKDEDTIIPNKQEFLTVFGIDLSSEQRPGNVIFVLSVNKKTGKRHPLAIHCGAWSSPETAEMIARLDGVYHPDMIMVENNAYQDALIDWCRVSKERFAFWSRLEPFTTGKNKVDPDIGLPSIEVELKNGAWVIPGAVFLGHDPACDCGWCRWKREMLLYPLGDGTDTVMACWVARQAVSYLTSAMGASDYLKKFVH